MKNIDYNLLAEKIVKEYGSGIFNNPIFKELLRQIIEEERLKPIKIPIALLDDEMSLPVYAKPGDSGMDIMAKEDIVLGVQETVIIKAGIIVALKEGYELQVRPRSGLSLHTRLRIKNAPGTIDSGYRKEIGAISENSSILETGEYKLDIEGTPQGTLKIEKGDRIAQIVLSEVKKIEWDLQSVEKVKSIGTSRGGGFGHSGLKIAQ